MLPADVLSPEFRAAPTEMQIASVCLTHADAPRRTAVFVSAVRSGQLQMRLYPPYANAEHALALLGIDPSLAVHLPAPPRRALERLRPQFWRGTLSGQAYAVAQGADDVARLGQFHTAWNTGLLPRGETMSRALVGRLVRLGVRLDRPVPAVD